MASVVSMKSLLEAGVHFGDDAVSIDVDVVAVAKLGVERCSVAVSCRLSAGLSREQLGEELGVADYAAMLEAVEASDLLADDGAAVSVGAAFVGDATPTYRNRQA